MSSALQMGMIRFAIAVLILLPISAFAQQPAASPTAAPAHSEAVVAPPDYKTMYEQANAAAAAWKARSEVLEGQLAQVRQAQTDVASQNAAVRKRAEVNAGAYALPRRGPIAVEGVVGGNPNGTRATGVPASIAADIRAKAEEKWPNDYHMQKYEIDKQEKAYRELHGS